MKNDDTPKGCLICDHCHQTKKVYMGEIAVYFLGRKQDGSAVLRDLCLKKCRDIVFKKARDYKASKSASIATRSCSGPQNSE